MKQHRLFIIVLAILFSLVGFANTADAKFIVRTIYFQPTNTEYVRSSEIAEIIEYAQKLYATEMELQGFGQKTFTLERDSLGDVVVHRVNGRKSVSGYQNDTFNAVTREMPDNV